MIKIVVAIYLFGVYFEAKDFYDQYNLYMKYKDFIDVRLRRVIEIIFWPIIWLKNFIEYYLDTPKDFKKD